MIEKLCDMPHDSAHTTLFIDNNDHIFMVKKILLKQGLLLVPISQLTGTYIYNNNNNY